MADKVTQSETGQGSVPPTREERDAAFSTGGGRKAAEVPKAPRHPLEAPVGLDVETRADEEWADGMYHDTLAAAEDAEDYHPQSPPGNESESDELTT